MLRTCVGRKSDVLWQATTTSYEERRRKRLTNTDDGRSVGNIESVLPLCGSSGGALLRERTRSRRVTPCHGALPRGGPGTPLRPVAQVRAFVPEVPGAAAQEHHENFAAVGVLIRTVDRVPSEHVIAGSQF